MLLRDDDFMPLAASQHPETIARKSVWHIVIPLILLCFVLPSTAVPVIAMLGVGPARPGGVLSGPVDVVGALIWEAPTALWAVGWLFEWSGERDVIETRVAFGLVASLFSVYLCFSLWLAARFLA